MTIVYPVTVIVLRFVVVHALLLWPLYFLCAYCHCATVCCCTRVTIVTTVFFCHQNVATRMSPPSTPERQPPLTNSQRQHQSVINHQQSTSPPVNTVSPSKATTDLITLLHASSCRHLMQRQMLKLRNWIVRHLLKNDIVIRVVAPSASVRPDHTTTVTCCTTCFHTVQDYHKNA